MEKQIQWESTTGWLFKSVLIFSLAGIIGVIAKVFAVFGAIGKAVDGDLAGGVSGLMGATGAIDIIVGIAVIAGYVLFFMNIGKLAELVHTNDAEAVGRIRTAFILNIVTAVIALI